MGGSKRLPRLLVTSPPMHGKSFQGAARRHKRFWVFLMPPLARRPVASGYHISFHPSQCDERSRSDLTCGNPNYAALPQTKFECKECRSSKARVPGALA